MPPKITTRVLQVPSTLDSGQWTPLLPDLSILKDQKRIHFLSLEILFTYLFPFTLYDITKYLPTFFLNELIWKFVKKNNISPCFQGLYKVVHIFFCIFQQNEVSVWGKKCLKFFFYNIFLPYSRLDQTQQNGGFFPGSYAVNETAIANSE